MNLHENILRINEIMYSLNEEIIFDPKKYNFHKIPQSNNNYRSAELNSSNLKKVIENYNIKNIIRLNGDGVDSAGLDGDSEKKICEQNSCKFYKLSATRNQDEINRLLNEGNTLVHCHYGADRTGGAVGAWLKTKGWDTKKIWDYTTQYNNWNGELKGKVSCRGNCWGENPDGRHLELAKKFGVKNKSEALKFANAGSSKNDYEDLEPTEIEKKIKKSEDKLKGTKIFDKLENLEGDFSAASYFVLLTKLIDIIFNKGNRDKIESPDKEKEKVEKSDEPNNTIIFMGGLESQKSLSSQTQILQKSLPNKKIISFSYTDLSGVLNAMNKNPDSYVILFSAACSKSSSVANNIKNKSKLFIVEPYTKSDAPNTIKSVKNAVSTGVPSTNVIVGSDSSRGLGVVDNPTQNKLSGHFDALKFVATLIK